MLRVGVLGDSVFGGRAVGAGVKGGNRSGGGLGLREPVIKERVR